MTSPTEHSSPTFEYIALVALLISIGAIGTDLMLPALDLIGSELGVTNANDVHYIVTAFFLGMAAGQLIAGPLSDTFGRKPVIYVGYGIFVLGSLVSLVTDIWAVMLAGRVLQGIGAAAPRIVTVALVRDAFSGRAMAKVMSIVMAAFIIVPIIAPMLGQVLIYIGGWRSTFLGLAFLAMAVVTWFAVRMEESLPQENRRAFKIDVIVGGLGEVVRSRSALGYTIASGLIYGMFVGYLGSAQQIFEVTFNTGDLFVFYFAIASASLGAASLLNAYLVMRFGMQRLTITAVVLLTAISFSFLLLLTLFEGVPPLYAFLIWQLSAFFCVGITFGNLNALALEPLGHIAGLASAFVGSIATFLSLPLAAAIGQRFDGTVYPLVVGFAVLAGATCIVMVWTNLAPETAEES